MSDRIRRVVGGLAFLGAPPRRPLRDDEDYHGEDAEGRELSYEAWLIQQGVGTMPLPPP